MSKDFTYHDMNVAFIMGFVVATVFLLVSCITVHYCTNNWWEREMITRNIGSYDVEHKFQFKTSQEISSEMLDKWKATKQPIEATK